MTFQVPQENLFGINSTEYMLMLSKLPLVISIGRKDERRLYIIDNTKKYRTDFGALGRYSTIDLEQAEEICRKYGELITEEQFSEATKFPVFTRSDGSYREYSVKL